MSIRPGAMNMPIDTLNTDIESRLRDVIAWTMVAKENLPDLNNALVGADRVATASALIDRMYRAAVALTAAPAVAHSRAA
jgi:hypothetical protein